MLIRKLATKGIIICCCNVWPAHTSDNFKGVLIGLKAGYSFSNSRFHREINKTALPIGKDDKFDLSGQSFMGGALLEYNYLFSKSYLIGAQINASLSDLNGEATNYNFIPPQSISSNLRMKQSYGIATRLGYTVQSILPYIKLGVVKSKFRSRTNGGILSQGSTNKQLTGYELGGGIDYSLNKNFIIGAEFVHVIYQKLAYHNRNSFGETLHVIKVTPQINTISLHLKFKI
jgi:outer membrane immunogenic protein